MNKIFGDKSIAINYIQQILHDSYNDNAIVNDEYYKTFDMNYGLAHFIAKYLDTMYPLLDSKALIEYRNLSSTKDTNPRPITEPISIMNYFLCSNDGRRLKYDPTYDYTINMDSDRHITSITNIVKKSSGLYDQIYNKFMTVSRQPEINETRTDVFDMEPEPKYKKYFQYNDPPLFTSWKKIGDKIKYEIDNNIIFTLQSWKTKKEICEIDDIVASYLLGMTIGPNSTAEDILYVQKLLVTNRDLTNFEKGVWCPNGYKGTEYDMTQTVINYQRNIASVSNNYNVFVTGYFDIFTEAYTLKEAGSKSHGILGL